MKLRFFLPLLVCIPARAGDRPNVLFVVVDDLRSEIGAYGCESVQSPNLDRLAKSAVTFDRAFCQQAVCSPSRTSVMTGLRPDTSKVWDLQTHFRAALPDVVTLGQHFRNHGYFVQGMGKIYHSGELDDPPTWSVPWQVPASELYGSPESRAIHERRMSSQLGSPLPQHLVQPPILPSKPGSRGPAFEAADVPDDTFQDGKVAELAIATLHELRAKPEPFFLAVGFIRPHLPFVAPKKYWDLYDPEKIPLAPNKFRPHAAPAFAIQDGSEMRHYHGIPTGSVPDDLARKLKHGYYAAISYADAQIGKVLDELDRLGLRENTIVIFWGDHGWKLGEHDAWCKHSNCENDARAPLLLSVPGMKRAGAHSGALVELVDIYPTLCELAGLPLPAHLEGLSFKPLIEDPDRAWKQAAFSQYPRRGDGRDLMATRCARNATGSPRGPTDSTTRRSRLSSSTTTRPIRRKTRTWRTDRKTPRSSPGSPRSFVPAGVRRGRGECFARCAARFRPALRLLPPAGRARPPGDLRAGRFSMRMPVRPDRHLEKLKDRACRSVVGPAPPTATRC